MDRSPPGPDPCWFRRSVLLSMLVAMFCADTCSGCSSSDQASDVNIPLLFVGTITDGAYNSALRQILSVRKCQVRVIGESFFVFGEETHSFIGFQPITLDGVVDLLFHAPQEIVLIILGEFKN